MLLLNGQNCYNSPKINSIKIKTFIATGTKGIQLE